MWSISLTVNSDSIKDGFEYYFFIYKAHDPLHINKDSISQTSS